MVDQVRRLPSPEINAPQEQPRPDASRDRNLGSQGASSSSMPVHSMQMGLPSRTRVAFRTDDLFSPRRAMLSALTEAASVGEAAALGSSSAARMLGAHGLDMSHMQRAVHPILDLLPEYADGASMEELCRKNPDFYTVITAMQKATRDRDSILEVASRLESITQDLIDPSCSLEQAGLNARVDLAALRRVLTDSGRPTELGQRHIDAMRSPARHAVRDNLRARELQLQPMAQAGQHLAAEVSSSSSPHRPSADPAGATRPVEPQATEAAQREPAPTENAGSFTPRMVLKVDQRLLNLLPDFADGKNVINPTHSQYLTNLGPANTRAARDWLLRLTDEQRESVHKATADRLAIFKVAASLNNIVRDLASRNFTIAGAAEKNGVDPIHLRRVLTELGFTELGEYHVGRLGAKAQRTVRDNVVRWLKKTRQTSRVSTDGGQPSGAGGASASASERNRHTTAGFEQPPSPPPSFFDGLPSHWHVNNSRSEAHGVAGRGADTVPMPAQGQDNSPGQGLLHAQPRRASSPDFSALSALPEAFGSVVGTSMQALYEQALYDQVLPTPDWTNDVPQTHTTPDDAGASRSAKRPRSS